MSQYVLSNSQFSFTFAASNGCLISMKNKQTSDEYLKGTTNGGNMFCAYVDPWQGDPTWLYTATSMSAALWWMYPAAVNQSSCVLTSWVSKAAGLGATMTLNHQSTGLVFTLDLTITATSPALLAKLSVLNSSSATHNVYMAFPHLTGIQLGSTTATNLGITNRFSGVAGVSAWQDIGGIYPLVEGTQMQSVWEPSLGEGLSVCIQDATFADKVIRRDVGGVISVVHYANYSIGANTTYAYPAAQIMVHKGDWRVAADSYGAWLSSAVSLRPALPWLDNISVYTGRHCSDYGYAYINDFREIIGAWYLGTTITCVELAMYSDGEQSFQLQSDGIYNPRSDLGGAALLQTAITQLHGMGRYLTLYVAALHCSQNSPLLTTPATNLMLYAHMSSIGTISPWSDQGYIPMCVGFSQWQDNLATACKNLLQSTGADGIRLDQLAGAMTPCYNPAHNHPSPIGGAQWVAALLTKVRAAMDSVNTNAVLLTEYATDHMARYTNGALVTFMPGQGAPILHRVIPSYAPIGYNSGSIESALGAFTANGADDSFRTYWDSGSWYLPRPSTYPTSAGPQTRWSELLFSMKNLMRTGQPIDTDPTPLTGYEKWSGRTWLGSNWCLMLGAVFDGSSLAGLRVYLKGIPTSRSFTYAVEMDAMTMQYISAPFARRPDGSYMISLSSSFSAVLLMTTSSPPLIQASPADVPLNERAVSFTLSAYAPWTTNPGSPTVNITAGSFAVTDVNGNQITPQSPVVLPSTLTFTLNRPTTPRYFPYACLNVDVVGSGVIPFRRILRGPIDTEQAYLNWGS